MDLSSQIQNKFHINQTFECHSQKFKIYKNYILSVYRIHGIFRSVPGNEKFDKPQMTSLPANIWVQERTQEERQACILCF